MVVRGRGQALIVETGMSTEFGRISRWSSPSRRAALPFRSTSIDRAQPLGKGALAVIALIVVIGLTRGQPVVQMFMFGIAPAAAVVPEALRQW